MILSVKDVSKLLGISQKSVYRWIKEGRIPFQKIGDQYRFERSELFEFAMRERLRPNPALLQEADEASEVVISQSLSDGGIFYRVEGSTKKDAISNSLNMIKGLDQGVTQPLLEMFLAREELASTGIGDGIAIPHARGPLIGLVSRPLLSLSFLENPVEFQALDGKPVQALFLLVSPTVRTHLRILGQLAFALRDPVFKNIIQEQASRETILRTLRDLEAGFPAVSKPDSTKS